LSFPKNCHFKYRK